MVRIKFTIVAALALAFAAGIMTEANAESSSGAAEPLTAEQFVEKAEPVIEAGVGLELDIVPKKNESAFKALPRFVVSNPFWINHFEAKYSLRRPNNPEETTAFFQQALQLSETPLSDYDVLLVLHVTKGSPAYRAGIRRWDYVTAIDGKPVVGMTKENILELLRGEDGSSVTIEFSGDRDNGRSTSTVKIDRTKYHRDARKFLRGRVGLTTVGQSDVLIEATKHLAPDATGEEWSKAALSGIAKTMPPGASERDLTLELGRHALGAFSDVRSMVVVHVSDGSPAENAGIKVNDHIVKVDGESVNGYYEGEVLEMILGDPDTEVSISVVRPGTAGELTFVLRRYDVMPGNSEKEKGE